jgi:type IV pilus assembly protein PilC
MSRPPENPRPPRKSSPEDDPQARERAIREEGESTTFRPNPKKAPSKPEATSPRAEERGPSGAGGSTFRPNPRKALSTGADGTSAGPKVKKFGTGDPPKFYERVLFGRVSSGQLAAFCRQFAAYLDAGVDIVKSLTSLQGQFARTALGPVLGRVLDGVRRGDTLTDTVEHEPKAFDKLFVSMIKVAEARGGVPETLKMMGRHYESRQNLIRQARSAMIYPIIVLICAGGVTALLTIWLLPMFASLLKDLGAKEGLPLPSRVLMAFSDFIQHSGWIVLPVAIVGTPILLFQLYRTEGGKRVMDVLALRIPVFGPLLRKLDTTRFARALSSLLNAGVDVGSSLALTSEIMRLEPFRRAIEDTRSQVIHGEELSVALDNTRTFGVDVIAIVNSGEETGKIPESLNHLANDYEEQVAYTVKNLGQLVQPLLMIMMGGLVLFIILAVLLPYFSMLTGLSKPP